MSVSPTKKRIVNPPLVTDSCCAKNFTVFGTDLFRPEKNTGCICIAGIDDLLSPKFAQI